MVLKTISPGCGVWASFMLFFQMFYIPETLTISPRKEKFERALNKTLGEIPVLLCEAAVTLDGSMQPANLVGPEELRDMEFSPLSVNTKSGSR